jgi:hypothetical protein
MTSGLDRRTRLIHAIDALSLAKLLVAAVGAFVGTAAPLYALGIVFWLPIGAAAMLVTLRWLGVPVAGRVPTIDGALRAPPARLGLPLSEQLARRADRQSDRGTRQGRVTARASYGLSR